MKATVSLRTLVSIKFHAAAAALATLGLAAGCASSEGEEREEREESTGEVSQALCCIEYVCPTNGYDTMGCKGGTGAGTINGAYKDCDNHCPGSCTSSGLLCY